MINYRYPSQSHTSTETTTAAILPAEKSVTVASNKVPEQPNVTLNELLSNPEQRWEFCWNILFKRSLVHWENNKWVMGSRTQVQLLITKLFHSSVIWSNWLGWISPLLSQTQCNYWLNVQILFRIFQIFLLAARILFYSWMKNMI